MFASQWQITLWQDMNYFFLGQILIFYDIHKYLHVLMELNKHPIHSVMLPKPITPFYCLQIEENILTQSWQRRESSATTPATSPSLATRAPGLEIPFPLTLYNH